MTPPRPPSGVSPGELGMSLVELLVVLAIVGIATVLAMPNYRGPTKGVELSAIASNLAGHLRSARATAIGRGRPQAVAFTVSERFYVTEADRRVFRFPADMEVSLNTANALVRDDGAARVVFFPDGSSTGAQIRLQRASRTIDIGVEWLTGLVSLEVRP